MRLTGLFVALFCGLISTQALALDIDQMPIKLGDAYQQVKDAYKTSLEPEPVKTTTPGSTAVRLKTKGVWFFFNRESKVYTIRLDAPFPGNVGGVKINDSVVQMQKVLGKPAKIPPTQSTLQPRSYVYYLDDVTTVVFRANSDDEIETIFILK